ncbi:preprotein translocase subunit SecE [bacterium]|nr:preprotein translocase subunit SecE [bacterium]
MQNKIKEFFGDVFAEMKRITWPSRKDNINYTVTVIIFVLISAIFLGITDKLIQEILKLVK